MFGMHYRQPFRVYSWSETDLTVHNVLVLYYGFASSHAEGILEVYKTVCATT